MRLSPNEFISPVVDPKMPAITHIDQALLASPFTGVDHAVQANMASNEALQRGFTANRGYFRVDAAVELEETKDNVFP